MPHHSADPKYRDFTFPVSVARSESKKSKVALGAMHLRRCSLLGWALLWHVAKLCEGFDSFQRKQKFVKIKIRGPLCNWKHETLKGRQSQHLHAMRLLAPCKLWERLRPFWASNHSQKWRFSIGTLTMESEPCMQTSKKNWKPISKHGCALNGWNLRSECVSWWQISPASRYIVLHVADPMVFSRITEAISLCNFPCQAEVCNYGWPQRWKSPSQSSQGHNGINARTI